MHSQRLLDVYSYRPGNISGSVYILPIYTLCSKKTCDHVFDDKLKWNYPFTKIFGTLITKSIGHRQVNTCRWPILLVISVPKIFIFPPHLFSTATLPWENVKT